MSGSVHSSSQNNKVILVINDHGSSYFKPFEHLGLPACRDHNILRSNPERVALVVFTGGADVSPQLYDKSPHHTTSSSTARDVEEVELYNLAEAAGIPKAGICRGAQFLCVMAGGVLIQHITGHTCGRHKLQVKVAAGDVAREVTVTSTHHQMQYPAALPKSEYEILGWMKEPRSSSYSFDDEITVAVQDAGNDLKIEPDVVWYPRIKALAAQFHPEWMEEDSDGLIYYRELIDHYLVPLMEINETQRQGKAST